MQILKRALQVFGLPHQLARLAAAAHALSGAALRVHENEQEKKNQRILEEFFLSLATVEVYIDQMRIAYGDGPIDTARAARIIRIEQNLELPHPSQVPVPRVTPPPLRVLSPSGKNPKNRKPTPVIVDGVRYPSVNSAATRLHLPGLAPALREGATVCKGHSIRYEETGS